MEKVLITWASSWLWFELSKVFLENWYQVIWLSRTKPDLNINFIETDLTDKKSIEKSINVIKKDYFDFSCVMCCAWIWYIENLENMNFDHTDEVFKVNIIWQSYLLSWLSKNIKENNSDLIFVWATIWYKWNEFMPMYSATKWWFRWLIENFRLELKNTKSRVIWVHPGWLNTDSNIWENWRETIISGITWKKSWSFLDAKSISNLIFSFIKLPKNMEISEIIINRK